MPTIAGIDHVALTVTDLAVSVPFYTALWGSPPVASMNDGPFRRQVFALPGGTIPDVTFLLPGETVRMQHYIAER